MQAKLSAEDTLAVHEVIARYAHINDNYQDNLEKLAQFRLVFSENIIWEGHHGSRIEHLEGLDAVLPRYAQQANIVYRVDHHLTSTIITSFVDGQVRARTHFISVKDDRTAGSGDYLDVLELTDDGWRIVERKIVSRLPPPAEPGSADVYDGWEIL